jgi:hypothetical protein
MPRSRPTFFLLVLVLFALSFAGNAQTTPAATASLLKPGKAVMKTLQSGQSHEYKVPLKAGEAFKATVMQNGVDVLITAYAPDGTKLGTFDSPTSTTYKEFVTVVAKQAGNYRLVLTPFEEKAAPGAYQLTLDRILTPAQYAQSQTEDRKRADEVATYLRAPHPDKTASEQRAEMLKLDPAALMPSATVPEVEAARWLEGTWTSNTKRFANDTDPEIVFPARTNALSFDPKKPTMLNFDEGAKGKFEPYMAFEPHSRQWVQAYMDAGEANTVSWGLYRGTDWANNQLVLEGDATYMGLARHQRQTWTKTDDRTVRVLTEERKADGSWMPVAETMYTKTNPATISAK